MTDLATPERSSTVRRALTVFSAVSALLSVVLAAALVTVVRHSDHEQALRRADRLSRALANDVVGRAFDLDDPRREQVLDQLLGSRVQDGSIVRIKVWTPDGVVVWADDHRLIGKHYGLAPVDEALAGTRDSYAETTDLLKPENEYEVELSGPFIEVYAGFFDRRGRPLVFEAYLPADHLRTGLLRLDLIGVAVLWLLLSLALMLPLAVSLAKRVDRAQAAQQRSLRHAIEASELERRRLAQDLHDGVIQDLAGVGYLFAALEGHLRHSPDGLATARRGGCIVQRDVTALRTLSTDLWPPDLTGDGLESALESMLEDFEQAGVSTSLEVDSPADLRDTCAQLAYRVVREALRNVHKHAAASHVDVAVSQVDGVLRVRVRDDGAGFDAGASSPDGHLGLRVLRHSVTDAGGSLRVESARSCGTLLEARLPLG